MTEKENIDGKAIALHIKGLLKNTTEKENIDWKAMALQFGGVLKTAQKENTDEWMKYRDDVITDAERIIAIGEDKR